MIKKINVSKYIRNVFLVIGLLVLVSTFNTKSVLAFDLSSISSPVYTYNSSSGTENWDAVFSPDGIYVFYIDRVGTTLRLARETLSTPFDLSTANSYTYDDEIDNCDIARSLFIDETGTKVFISNNSSREVCSYSMSAWNPSTLTTITTYDWTSDLGSVSQGGIFFKSDGTEIYLAEGSTDEIHQLSLSTPWDISTTTYTNTFSIGFTVNCQASANCQLFFRSDGLQFLLLEENSVYEFSLSSAWDISTATYTTDTHNFSLGDAMGMWLNLDNSKIYISNDDGDIIYYTLTSDYSGTETCSDGIENQDETGVDVGGVCSSVEWVVPTDLETLEDFDNWQVDLGALGVSSNFAISIHYSNDDATIVEDCEEFPSGIGAGYDDCINGDPEIVADYSAIFSSGVEGIFSIPKSHPLITGSTYYAQIIVQEDDQFGAPLFVSDIIEFTVGVPTGGGGGLPGGGGTCTTFDILCWGKQLLGWAFLPSDASLQQFSNLTLENSLPFSYIYDLGNVYDELFANSGSQEFDVSISTGIGDITMMSASILSGIPFANTVKTLLGYIAYLLTAMTIYRIIINRSMNTPTTS